MRSPVLSIDVETCCEADLRKVGASKYSKDPSLVVTVFAWAFDDDPVKSTTCVEAGERVLPPEVEEHLRAGGVFRAWNASFESAILRNYFGVPIKPEQVSCTMQRALFAGLPGALGDAGPALRLNIVKDITAHRLMMQMAKPRKGRAGQSFWHEDDPDKLAALRAYCERDVDAERAIARHIPELPERERQISILDRLANERGLKVDRRLIESMIRIADVATIEINRECAEITGGRVKSPGTETAKLIKWLKEAGLEIDAVDKESVTNALRVEQRNDVRAVLRLRQTAAKSSVKKLKAMINCAEEDDCVRGTLAYYGASRTGRWAGRLLQPQNMVRPTIKNPNDAIRFILRGGDAAGVETLFGSPLWVIASCLRGCLTPRDGMRFISFDLAQIEARLVAYLAGQQDILDVFARGDDVYTHTSDKIGLGSRQAGKCCVLGLGFGLGKVRFVDFAAGYGLTFDEQQAEKIVYDWRDANSKIVGFWWACDQGVKEAITTAAQSPLKRAQIEINQFISVQVSPARNGSPLMTIMLPSGRRLYYRDVALELNPNAFNKRAEMTVTYSGVDQITKKWGRIRSFGGRIVENCTQAVARDVVADMALEIARQKLGDLVLSVHDELVLEVPEHEAEARFKAISKIMNTAPSWAPTLPVTAEGAILDRYGK